MPGDDDKEVVDQEPDPRFTLANERTFLAWNRTALGAMVAGMAISHLFDDSLTDDSTRVAGLALIVLSACLSVLSFIHWRRCQLAMRRSAPMPSTIAMPLLAAVTGIVALAAAFSVF